MNMGSNVGVPSMIFNLYGGRSRKDYDSEESSDEESSSSDSEGEAVAAGYKLQASNAVGRTHPDIVTVQQVQTFEQTLDLMETISLIFLLFDDHLYALQTIKVLVAQGPEIFSKHYISDWVMKKGPADVSKKLLESLAVIQNYRVLKDLGITEIEARERFLPSIDCTLTLNRVKKMLFLLVDSLGSEQVKALVENVQSHGRELFKNDITAKCNPKYTEFHLLFWMDRGYITIDCKQPGLDNLISVMTESAKHVVPFELSPELKNRLDEIKSMVKDLTKPKIIEELEEDNIYPIIDEKNVGLILIINNDNFEKREQRKKYLNLLPPEPLGNRNGSELDVKRLHAVFTTLNFKVVVINNISHYKFQDIIETNVKANFSPNHSMLFLCVLSHGGEGVIYGANSCPVRIKSIRNMICGRSEVGRMFANKPRAIFVQACQGSGRLCVETGAEGWSGRGAEYELDSCEGACLDGPSHFSPEQADVLVCLAVIEGYAAIRHQKQGSFYIHELCKTINKYRGKEHLEEMVVRVHKILNNKRIHVQLSDVQRESPCDEGHMDCAIMYMTPKKESTLQAKLYLTKQISRC